MTGKIIIIEGSEATGKSSLSKRLCESLGGIHFHNPSGETEQINELYEYIKTYSNVLKDDTMLLLMLATHITNINQMNQLKANGEVVVCDRSILSTFAYNTTCDVDNFNEIIKINNIPKLNYDRAFVLSASRDTILNRLGSRSDNDSMDDIFVQKIDSILDRYKMFRSIYNDAIELNTDNKTLEETFLHAIQFI